MGVGDGWLATCARSMRIAWLAFVCGIMYAAASVRRLFMRSARERAEHRARWRGRLLRWSFERLGGTFLKIGQVMSSRPDVCAPGVIRELRQLQDHVHPFPYRHVRRIIETELHAPVETLFRELDEVPVAAGSIAQVHRAVLHSGDEVAVKVLRRGVVGTVRRDARILLTLARVARTLSRAAREADVVGHVRCLITGLLAQTDLRYERVNYERFRRNFADARGVRFPRVYTKLSSRRVLTMEYVHGSRIDEAHAAHRPAAIEAIRRSFFAMCFEHGFVHADLHPGNVLVAADGSVVILDVGLVKRLPRELLDQVANFTQCLTTGTPGDLVEHLRTYHHYLGNTDWSSVEADAAIFVAGLRRRSMIEIELGAVIGELFALARKHGIRPMPEVTLVLLGMVTNEGMAKQLDPKANVIAELGRYLAPVVARVRRPMRLARGSGEIVPQRVLAAATEDDAADIAPVPSVDADTARN